MGQESRRSLQSRGIGTPLLVLPTVFIRDLGSDLQHHCSGLCRVDRLSPPHSVLPLGFYLIPLFGRYSSVTSFCLICYLYLYAAGVCASSVTQLCLTLATP